MWIHIRHIKTWYSLSIAFKNLTGLFITPAMTYNNLVECESRSLRNGDGIYTVACHEKKKQERLPGPLNQDASKVPYSLHVPSDWANQVYKSNNRKTCVQTTMKSSTLLTSFTSYLLETNVHLLKHSGNNGHQCEESSTKCVCFKQRHQFVFISHIIIPFQSQI